MHNRILFLLLLLAAGPAFAAGTDEGWEKEIQVRDIERISLHIQELDT
ncbi:unnamed protein product, partial [marine sediment metagenome]